MIKYEFTYNYKGAKFGVYVATSYDYEYQLITPGTLKTFSIKAVFTDGHFLSRDYTKLRNQKNEIIHVFDDVTKKEGSFAVLASIKESEIDNQIIQELLDLHISDVFFQGIYKELEKSRENLHEKVVTLCRV